MYYYIFDLKKLKKRSQVESIKDHLNVLGISGEFSFPSAAQTTEELVKLALSKQYTTIVSVGGDELAADIASQLVGRKEAMGIIPLESSEELCSIVGTDNWREACEILRYRKINEIFLGRLATGKSFLTKIELAVNSPVDITVELKDCLIEAKVSRLIIANYISGIKKVKPDLLDIILYSVAPEEGVLSKLSYFFGRREDTENNYSIFRARSLRLFSKMQIPLLSAGKVVAKTPQYIESTDEKLRLITAKNSVMFWGD